MKRDFDRKSCDGIKAVDKKEGSGSHKWGTFEDEIKAKDDKAFTSEADPKEATNAPAGLAFPTAEDEEALAQKAAEEEEEGGAPKKRFDLVWQADTKISESAFKVNSVEN